MKDKIYQYLLMLGDNSMILGHRLSELCGHGPNLETDIALTNISLDLFGQVRNYFQYAAELKEEGTTEDDIAFLRYEHEYKNTLLTEQPNTDFAWVIGRQFLFDAFHLPLLEQLVNSNDDRIEAIATKSLKEVKYHYRFSSVWVKRLGGGTTVSREKMQTAIDSLWTYTNELFLETEIEKEMKIFSIGADLDVVRAQFDVNVHQVLNAVNLQTPNTKDFQQIGKNGVHTEQMGYILSELQYMQRAYPNMNW